MSAIQFPFVEIGEDVAIWPMAKIVLAEKISLGNSIIIDDFAFLMGGERTRIGDFVHIGAHTTILGGGEFEMGDFSALSAGVRIFTGNEDYSGQHMTNPTVPHPFRIPVRGYVRIGKHAVVGSNAVILPGVTIGEGAVIGATSLVTRDCAPWTTYLGSPARKIAERPKDTILRLEQELRAKAYDPSGRYVAKSRRKP